MEPDLSPLLAGAADAALGEADALVRERVGPVAAFKACAVVPALPKTRSGKILRNVIRLMADGGDYLGVVPGTIEDVGVLDGCREALQGIGYAADGEK